MRPDTSSLSLTWWPPVLTPQPPLLPPHHPALGSQTHCGPHQASKSMPCSGSGSTAVQHEPFSLGLSGSPRTPILIIWFKSTASNLHISPLPFPDFMFYTILFHLTIISFLCLHLGIESKPRVYTRGTKWLVFPSIPSKWQFSKA